jgi:hypothetical protein
MRAPKALRARAGKSCFEQLMLKLSDLCSPPTNGFFFLLR